jgi:hypothetical protein
MKFALNKFKILTFWDDQHTILFFYQDIWCVTDLPGVKAEGDQ